MMPAEHYTYVSSRLVKEVVALGGIARRPRSAGRRGPARQPARDSHHASRMSTDTLRLAERMRHIALSPTMKGTIEAERLRRQGVDVVDLGAGEPDFPTPAHIAAAAHARSTRNFTKYTANMGDRGAARGRLPRATAPTTAWSTAPTKCIVTAGGKQALVNAALALFGPGDEVITHAPGWPTSSSRSSWPTRRR